MIFNMSESIEASCGAISVVDTPDASGGTIRTITAVNISDTTAIASDVASGKYFYTADGTKTQGTASGGGGQAADFLKALCEDSSNLANYTELPVSPTSIGNSGFRNKSNLALTSLPSSVTSIGSNAFYNCNRLALTSLSNSVTSIGSNAFYNCSRLAITAIPDGITTINSYAFRGCTSLTELTIPASVTKINTQAFYDNTGMTAYHMLRTTPPTLSNANVFYNIPSGCKIYVPTGCLSAYQSASNWSTYASHMEEE